MRGQRRMRRTAAIGERRSAEPPISARQTLGIGTAATGVGPEVAALPLRPGYRAVVASIDRARS